jgi:hypothetical protein
VDGRMQRRLAERLGLMSYPRKGRTAPGSPLTEAVR